MILENDLPILEGMTALLERWNMRAVPTVSINEALEAMDHLQSIPDLIIADFHLDNGETGIQAIEAVRQRTGRAIPAIIITADRTQRLQQDAARRAVRVVHKPIRGEDLAAAVGIALG